MAILQKDRFIRDIAGAVGRGAMHFEKEDSPAVMIGGRQYFISSVFFDSYESKLAYELSDSRGAVIPSAFGLRPLSDLPSNLLKETRDVVQEYAAYRRNRVKNIVNLVNRTVPEQQKGRQVRRGVGF